MIIFERRKSVAITSMEAATTDCVVALPTPTVPPVVLKPL
jgi:hypothetical protein